MDVGHADLHLCLGAEEVDFDFENIVDRKFLSGKEIEPCRIELMKERVSYERLTRVFHAVNQQTHSLQVCVSPHWTG